jgi:hypothetical protein
MTATEQHHPSCTEYDKSLVQHCNQCGLNEPYDETRLETELHEMRRINRQQMAFFADASAYIRRMLKEPGFTPGQAYASIVATLAHDVNGIAKDEPCFLPRVTGYAKAEQETK